jgi:hypothetical protein
MAKSALIIAQEKLVFHKGKELFGKQLFLELVHLNDKYRSMTAPI